MSWTAFPNCVSDLTPGLLAGLAPPAPAEDLRALTAALNSPPPNDVHQVLATHNGQRAGHRLLFGLKPMSAHGITHHRQSVARLLEREGPVPVTNLDGRTQAYEPNPHHVPLFTDNTGNFPGFSLAPVASGVWGQVVVFGLDIPCPRVVANSFHTLFEELSAELRQGNFLIQEVGGYVFMKPGNGSALSQILP
ncbi:SMI1/KNR4 family protein [Deinococcus budaensis]|uniref:Cell wall assembly regulator SMI1 n=1 Tax=Deinococcus budaensis TaxID=1665626 RepID=A0A7W8GEW0_9DEIO|nr:cell wall assembly regulator SMI1 [Deinococcus budaensis]